jgi:hypothetical protein
MRRTRAIFLAPVVATLIALAIASPAGAHPEIRPNEGQVGRRATFTLLIDGGALSEVIITAPKTFRLDDVTGAAAWTRGVDAGTFRFTSTGVPNPSFQVTGTPTAKGIVAFSVVTTSPRGETFRYGGSCLDPNAPLKGPMLFVGIDVITACEPRPAGRPTLVTLGFGLVAAGLVLGAGYPLVKRARMRSATR